MNRKSKIEFVKKTTFFGKIIIPKKWERSKINRIQEIVLKREHSEIQARTKRNNQGVDYIKKRASSSETYFTHKENFFTIYRNSFIHCFKLLYAEFQHQTGHLQEGKTIYKCFWNKTNRFRSNIRRFWDIGDCIRRNDDWSKNSNNYFFKVWVHLGTHKL